MSDRNESERQRERERERERERKQREILSQKKQSWYISSLR